MAARRGPSQSFKEKAGAGQWQHCHRERTSDRPGLWRGRLVERVLFAQRPARGWWARGDSRLIRTYALALGVAIVATQLLAARNVVDLGKSIYLQPSFSAP